MDGGVDDDMKTKLKQCAGMYLGGQEARGLDVRIVESLDIRAKVLHLYQPDIVFDCSLAS